MSINSDTELHGIQAAAHAVAITLKKMVAFAKIGMSTKELDDYGATILKEFGAHSAPSKDYDFPGCTCISVNHEACHGIPRADRILSNGDLINIDVSAELNGYYGDNGCSFILGEDRQGLQPLVTASEEILKAAIARIKSKVRISEIGGFIHAEAKKRGFEVIKNICGHGIGRKLHEQPTEIPNYRDRQNRGRFTKNSVIALETFISTRANYVDEAADGWTLVAQEQSFVAQHEHTLIITDGDPIVLTHENGVAY
jgi:methionyl aminopeptidase